VRENILDVLARGELIIGDGGFGTMLQAAGLPAGTIPEAWNMENPEAVQAAHKAYADAGSQIVTLNSFGGNGPRLADAGLSDKLIEINKLAVSLAREAVGDRVWLGGSVGPTGQLMEPFGPLSLEEAERIYAEQVTILAEAGADLILVETQHDVEEACAAVRMVKKHTDLPVFCSFAFNTKGRTMMGLRPNVAAQRVAEAGGDAVGANCGDGLAAVAAALEGMQGVVNLPFVAQANAGIPRAGADGTAIWDVTPEQMAEETRGFVEQGARIIGGCCGTNPTFIAAIVQALKG